MKEKFLPASLIGLALVISALVFGLFYNHAQSQVAATDILSVTGSAKVKVTSDQAKLTINISRIITVGELASGYDSVSRDSNLVKGLLQSKGINDNQITFSPTSMYQAYDSSYSSEIRYQLNQTVTVQSDDVQKITAISQEIPSLASKGAILSVQSLEYYYSKLPDLRVSLLSDAVQDAKARAEKIAAGTGRKIGNVQSASNGVVQVLSPNSVDISDYGSYDTASIDKDVMVTIKDSFRLK